MRAKNARSGSDRTVARVAARQHGVVTFTELDEAGIDHSGISRRVQAGRLHRIHRGVYAVGHAGLSNEGRWMAAVLACGPGAVLSHRAAGAIWEVNPPPSQIDVTVPGHAGRERRAGLKVHRSVTLLPSQWTIHQGIPVTTAARTLADLRRVLSDDGFAEALRKAEFLRLSLDNRFELDHTRSKLEARFLALCARHRLPKPEVNVRVGPFLVDFLWRERRLVVEVDGWRSHGTRSAFESDRARDAKLKLLGYDVVRFTWRQVTAEGKLVAPIVRTLLTDRQR
jgi:very-short-patch-repair endonuclease